MRSCWAPEDGLAARNPTARLTLAPLRGPKVRGGGRLEASLGIYPNPASDRVMVTIPEGMEAGSLDCFDSQGRLVHTFTFSGRPAFVEMSTLNWSEGLYMLRLHMEGMAVSEGKLTIVK